MNVQETPLRQEGSPAPIDFAVPNSAAVLTYSQAPIEKIRASYLAEVAQLATFALLRLHAFWLEGGELECRVGREVVLSR
jgi:hypothetical protein